MTQVTHEPASNRFVATVDGVQAHVDYELRDGFMVITHTIVPDQIGGRGVAGHLTRAAFEHAKAEGLNVRPACAYAAAWVERHPEYNQLLG